MKNKYHFPREAHNSNNNEYNRYVEDLFNETEKYGYKKKKVKPVRQENWTHNGNVDVYHLPKDEEVFQEDPYTVAQKFINRTEFPL